MNLTKFFILGIGDNIISNELIIELYGNDLPNLEIVDLPGMINVGDSLSQATNDIVDSYLHGEHTLVLCVVAATTDAMNDNLAINKVIQRNKNSQTIICLTKCDYVYPEVDNQVQRIINRIWRYYLRL